MEEELDLLELIHIVLNRKWIWITTSVIAVAIAVVFTLYGVTPVYKSETTLMVNSSKSSGISELAASFDIGSVNLSQKLVVTYSEIVKSRIVLEQVVDNLNLEMSYGGLLSSITSSPVGSTEILKISVSDVEPERAALIANEISSVFIKEVMRILKVNNVEIIDKAIPIASPVNVKLFLNIAIALVLGLMMGVFVIFILEMTDRTIKTSDDVEKHLGLNVLGSIIDFESVDKRQERR